MGGEEIVDIVKAIEVLDKQVPDPSSGLPNEVFYYISKTTPLVNVDLLIKDEDGRTLLSWRDDRYTGKGWHVPGGIVRFKEALETRIKKVAEIEIGASVIFDPVPIALNQIILPERDIRSHFISILYKCFLSKTFILQNNGLSIEDNGYLQWHKFCPVELLKCHEIYRKYITKVDNMGDFK
jgi:colanic acid biosynthesis protein WcaH